MKAGEVSRTDRHLLLREERNLVGEVATATEERERCKWQWGGPDFDNAAICVDEIVTRTWIFRPGVSATVPIIEHSTATRP
jgi:hypothetical protein